jgi:hypothetical protein
VNSKDTTRFGKAIVEQVERRNALPVKIKENKKVNDNNKLVDILFSLKWTLFL